MEISPVTGIRLMPTPKTPPKESGIAAIFDLEATARSGEDNYSNEKKKAAGAAGENVKNAFANDPRVKHAKRVDTLKKSAAIVRLAEVYWNTPGLETFIKTSGLDKNPGMKALLDEIRTLRTSKGVTKQANLDLFLNFKSALEALK